MRWRGGRGGRRMGGSTGRRGSAVHSLGWAGSGREGITIAARRELVMRYRPQQQPCRHAGVLSQNATAHQDDNGSPDSIRRIVSIRAPNWFPARHDECRTPTQRRRTSSRARQGGNGWSRSSVRHFLGQQPQPQADGSLWCKSLDTHRRCISASFQAIASAPTRAQNGQQTPGIIQRYLSNRPRSAERRMLRPQAGGRMMEAKGPYF